MCMCVWYNICVHVYMYLINFIYLRSNLSSDTHLNHPNIQCLANRLRCRQTQLYAKKKLLLLLHSYVWSPLQLTYCLLCSTTSYRGADANSTTLVPFALLPLGIIMASANVSGSTRTK